MHLKCTKTHLRASEKSKVSRGRNPRTPLQGEAASNAAGQRTRLTREGGGGSEREGRKGEGKREGREERVGRGEGTEGEKRYAGNGSAPPYTSLPLQHRCI